MKSSQTLEVPGYEVVQFLGSGARSTIWQIRNSRENMDYALKRVIKQNSSDSRFLEQAVNEYNVGSQLDHPVIRHVHRLRRIKRWLLLRVREIHLFMELCHGHTVQENRPTCLVEVARIFGQVGRALEYMNAMGFVHADMKPNNILVAPDGTVKIIDLGQSCRIGEIKKRIQGTPDFIAPEQVRRLPLDARTDVFNFGAALYWTLTGRPIPTILPKKNSVTLVSDLAVAPPETLNPDVPPGLSKLIRDCIEVRPSARPPSMGRVVSHLSLIAQTLKNKKNKTAEA